MLVLFIKFVVVVVLMKNVCSIDLHPSPKHLARLSLTPCVDDGDCIDIINATCENEFCTCNHGSNVCLEQKRVLVNKLGESCQTAKDCVNIDRSICSKNRKCACENNAVPSADRRNCLRMARGIGDSCEEGIQCYAKTAHSGCQERKCVCQQHMHEHGGACYKDVGFGEVCARSEECSHMMFSTCKNNRCTCKDGFIGYDNNCIAVVSGIGSACTEHIQCTALLGRGSHCTLGGRCSCNDLFHYKESRRKCVKDILLGNLCTFHSDCHQPGQERSRLECFLGNCACKPPYTELDGYCINSSARLLKDNIWIFISVLVFKIFS